MTPIVVRAVTAEDIPAIKDLYSAWWVDTGGSPENEQILFFTDLVVQSIKNDASQEKYLVATDRNGMLVGILGYQIQLSDALKTFATTENPVQLVLLMVEKNSVQKGVGTYLLKFFEDFSKRFSYSEILLSSSERWKDSWHFYRKMGYQDRGELPNVQGWHTKVFSKVF